MNKKYKHSFLSKHVSLWGLASIVLVTIIAIPVYTLVFEFFAGSGDEAWTHIKNTVLPEYVLNSLGLVLTVGLLALVLGVSSAWVISVCDIPFRSTMEWLLILPLAIPTYIAAYTYAGFFDYTGLFRSVFSFLFGLENMYFDIMNFWGVSVILALVLYPYVYVVARSSFMNQSGSLFEAARVLGSSSTKTFFKIALPIGRPAIIAGLSLVIMEVLNDYGAVKYFGVNTFTTGIFRAWFSLGSTDAAINLSGILMVFIVILLSVERLQRGRVRIDEGARTGKRITRYKPKGFALVMAMAACLIPLFFGFLVPFGQLLIWSWSTIGDVFTAGFFRLMLNSFGLALVSAFLAVLFSLLILYAVRVHKNKFYSILAKIAPLGYSIPGAVIAIGIMIPLLFFDKQIISFFESKGWENPGLILSGTLFALGFAYVVRFLMVSISPLDAAFKKVGTELDDAAKSLGASTSVTLWKINFPLVKSAALSGFILVFVDILKELPLTLILKPFNFHTLSTKAYQLASDEMVVESATPALIIVLIGVAPIIILNRLMSNND